MTHPVIPAEASPRPSIGRPAADPTAEPKNRITSKQRPYGTVLKIKVPESMALALDDAKRQLEDASGNDFPFSVLVRRSLDLYMAKFAKLTPEQIADEAITLKNTYR